jgi:NADH-quinone oxidoreductase subunit H
VGADKFEIVVNLLKMIVIFAMMIQIVPILVWAERRGSAFIQNRFGPNRVGPLGLVQLLADAVKFLFKEEFSPKKGVALLYYGAPVVALVPGVLALASIPLSPMIHIEPFTMLGQLWAGVDGHGYDFAFQGFAVNVGIVYILGVSSLGAYSLLMAGWGSANKYSLMGALRASAQMISYELALSLSLVGILLIYGTLSFQDMMKMQDAALTYTFFGQKYSLPFFADWGVFHNPIGMLLFASATFAECNRLPFDLPEAEGELVAGFHTEYGGFKMLLFYIGEYGHMLVASALLAIFYFGGYNIPHWFLNLVPIDHVAGNLGAVLFALVSHVFLLLKILLFLWVFIWVRWTLPRFRYDQLMDLGWKTMLPWALANVIFTAIWMYCSQG